MEFTKIREEHFASTLRCRDRHLVRRAQHLRARLNGVDGAPLRREQRRERSNAEEKHAARWLPIPPRTAALLVVRVRVSVRVRVRVKTIVL